MRNWKYINGAEVGNSTWEEPRRMPFTQTALKYAYEQAKKKGLSGRKLEEEMLRIAKTTPHSSAASESEMRKDVSEWVLHNGNPEDFVNNSKTENATSLDAERLVKEFEKKAKEYEAKGDFKNAEIYKKAALSAMKNTIDMMKLERSKAGNQDGVARMFEGLVKDENKDEKKDSGAIEELVGNAGFDLRDPDPRGSIEAKARAAAQKQHKEEEEKKKRIDGIYKDKDGHKWRVSYRFGPGVRDDNKYGVQSAEHSDTQKLMAKIPDGFVKISNSQTGNSASDDKFAYVMREFEAGKLKTPDGKVVTDPAQAKAIAYSESKKTENGIERAFKAMKV